MPGTPPPAQRPGWYRSALNRLGAMPPATFLLLLTGVIVAIGLLVVQSSFAQRGAREIARNEAASMLAVESVRQSLVDAETGQRGFLLTQDPAYLAPYEAARGRLPAELQRLKDQFSTSGNLDEQDRLRAIDGLLAERLSELDQTVRYARAGDVAAAIDVVRSDRGRKTMVALRYQLKTLAAAQHDRRQRAFTAAERAESRQVPLLLGMWSALILLVWAAVRGERRRAEAEAVARQAARLHELNERNKLLALELNHRVKNLFGVVLSLVGMAGREKGANGEVIAGLSGRIHALARAHSLAFGATPDSITALGSLLASVLEPYRSDSEERIVLRGGDCGVAARQVTALALVLHELATNAAKYGALSVPDGRVTIDWSGQLQPDGTQRATLVWREEGGPPPSGKEPDAGGFGTRMTAAVLRQIDGTIDRDWPASGAVVTLAFTLLREEEAASA